MIESGNTRPATSNAVASVTKTIEYDSSVSGVNACRCGQVVFLRIYTTQSASSSTVTLGTLPERFRPVQVLRTTLINNNTRTPVGVMVIRRNGNVELNNLTADATYATETCYLTDY